MNLELIAKFEAQEERIRNLERDFLAYKVETSSQLLSQKEETLDLKENLLKKDIIILELKKQLSDIEESKISMNDKVVDLQVQNKSFSFELSELKSELEVKERLISNLQFDNFELKNLIRNMEEKNNEYNEKYRSVFGECRNLASLVNEREKSLNVLKEENEVIVHQRDDLLRRYFLFLSLLLI